MAGKASNEEELLLVMRVGVGVFRGGAGSQEQHGESQGALHSDGQDDGAWHTGAAGANLRRPVGRQITWPEAACRSR
jgi:hypothetical protein